jgi:DNA-binding LytR/AlgR family response regulator
MTMLRAIVADDEPLAVRRLVAALARHGKVEVVATAADGAEALDAIGRRRPDLLFLDIAMPNLSGIDVVEAMDVEHPPAVIFVSAHRQYALDAFQTGAVDYLLKPLDRERLHVAIERAAAALANRDARERLIEMRAVVDALRQEDKRRRDADREQGLWVSRKGQVVRVSLSAVIWFASDGDYVRITTLDGEHFINDSLRNLEARLDQAQFIRVHRQAIVNIRAIASIRRGRAGIDLLNLANGDQVRVGRAYRPLVKGLLDGDVVPAGT